MENQPSPIEKTQRFFKNIQAGDITLFFIFLEAFAMFGFTKVGKTSSCHMVCDSPLSVQDIRGELMFKPTSKKYQTAKIGFTPESETQIPNIFSTFLKQKDPKDNRYKLVKEGTTNKPIIVLDQPGYADTFGFHRIFSNGYFHYRTFSKTPKLKFILAVSRQDLSGTAQKFKKTLLYFINTFKDWDKVKGKILKATSLLITKADVRTNIDSLRNIIEALKESVGGMEVIEKKQYQELIDEFLTKKRIYFIEKPKDLHSKTLECNILHEMYANSQFWERPVINNVVDMSDINFSVSSQILKQLRDVKKLSFRTDFQTYMSKMEQRMTNAIKNHQGSLVKIVKTLEQDAVGANDQKSFLDLMTKFVKDLYNFSPKYNKERQSLEVNLFKTPESQNWSQLPKEDIQRENRNVYFIKKFKVLEFLQKLNESYGNQFGNVNRTVESLENFSTMFQIMFKRFTTLNTNPKDKVIHRYSYIIQRIIEQSKIMALILFTDESVKEEISKLQVQQFSVDIFRTINDEFFAVGVGDINVEERKKQFIKNSDFNSLVSTITPQIIQFFESVDTKNDQQTTMKIASLITQYSSNLFRNERKPAESDKKFAVSKLYKYRNNFFAYLNTLQELDGSKKSKEKFTEQIFCLTNALAEVLKSYSFWKDARQCYRSVNNAMMIFEMYEQELKTLSLDQKNKRSLYIEYAKEANLYQRRQLGLKCAQNAYSLSSKYQQLEEASGLIVSLSTERAKLDEDEKNETCQIQEAEEELKYLRRLEGFQYCSDFSKNLRDNIQLAFDIEE